MAEKIPMLKANNGATVTIYRSSLGVPQGRGEIDCLKIENGWWPVDEAIDLLLFAYEHRTANPVGCRIIPSDSR